MRAGQSTEGVFRCRVAHIEGGRSPNSGGGPLRKPYRADMAKRVRGSLCHLCWVVFWGVALSGCAVGSSTHGRGEPERGQSIQSAEARGLTDAPRVEELSHYVLVLRESAGGGTTHEWRRVETFSLSEPLVASHEASTEGSTVFAVAHPRDCHEEFVECNNQCMKRPLPRGYGHMTKDRSMGAKARYCREQCWQPYRDCEELQGRKPQEFSAVDAAVDWLSLHRQTILKGTVVVIAGVVFFVASAGTGVVILAPVVLLNSAEVGVGASFLARMP